MHETHTKPASLIHRFGGQHQVPWERIPKRALDALTSSFSSFLTSRPSPASAVVPGNAKRLEIIRAYGETNMTTQQDRSINSVIIVIMLLAILGLLGMTLLPSLIWVG